MVRTRLEDVEWASLWLAIQDLPRIWKRDEGALRRFVEAALWICRTGAPWRDLPAALGHWASVYHRWRRWCRRGWWEVLFEARRPTLPAEGLVLFDSTSCKAHRAASGAARNAPAAEALGRSRGGLWRRCDRGGDDPCSRGLHRSGYGRRPVHNAGLPGEPVKVPLAEYGVSLSW